MENMENTYRGTETAVDDQTVRVGVVGTDYAVRRILSSAAVSGMEAGTKDVFIPWDNNAEEITGRSISFGEECYRRFLSEMDAVYIASSGETHYSYVKTALEHGKHVLCKTPVALRSKQAEELFRLADEKGCVLMEDITAAYCPGFTKLIQAARSGVIGAVRDVEADVSGYDVRMNAAGGEKCGGVFTELGSHALLPVLKLFGRDYKEVRFDSIRDRGGADVYTKASFVYKNGFAMSKAGTGISGDGQLMIMGTKGCITVRNPWWKLRSFEVKFDDSYKNEPYVCEFAGDGLVYVMQDFIRAVRSGERRDRKVTAAESVAIAGILEEFLERHQETGRDKADACGSAGGD